MSIVPRFSYTVHINAPEDCMHDFEWHGDPDRYFREAIMVTLQNVLPTDAQIDVLGAARVVEGLPPEPQS